MPVCGGWFDSFAWEGGGVEGGVCSVSMNNGIHFWLLCLFRGT